MNSNCCLNRCCNIMSKKYSNEFHKDFSTDYKSGVLFYDREMDRILIVQSRGNYWGVPKGTIVPGESVSKCASREVFEETNILITSNFIETLPAMTIDGQAEYYFFKCSSDEYPIKLRELDTHGETNDVNSISWMNIKCLKEMMKLKLVKINHHTKLVLEHFLDIKI